MNALAEIERAAREKRFDYAHFALARLIFESIEDMDDLGLWAAVVASEELGLGNVCVDLDRLSQRLAELDASMAFESKALHPALTASPAVGEGDASTPMVLDHQRLYLKRYFANEELIARRLHQLSAKPFEIDAAIKSAIDEVFPPAGEANRQRLAAVLSCRQRLAIISGGPGTGKTWTVGRIVEILRRVNPDLNLCLAAPTGKAAARLNESLLANQQLVASHGDEQIKAKANTLHSLLRIDRYSHRPRYHAENHLPCELLVVDEASMIDQRMMVMLLDALAPESRLILLGDRDQLASVEAGSVFADLCGDNGSGFSAQQADFLNALWPDLQAPVAAYTAGLCDHVVMLDESRRFGAGSAVGRMAGYINSGDADACLELLRRSSRQPDLEWHQPDVIEFRDQLDERLEKYYFPVVQADCVSRAFEVFNGFRILSPVWRGYSGVNVINDRVETRLKQFLGEAGDRKHFRGRAVMMTRNMPQHQVFNGDVGLVWPNEDGELRVYFDVGGEFRPLPLSLADDCISAWAMTVHKSQGSEYRDVLLVLPDRDGPVLTRELLYTGITRTVDRLELWSGEAVIRSTILRRTERMSGLQERLT